ncbi:MAG: hypothetical protein IAF02_19855 [Anaerolineae bacterium]|nr:hypothetical protein [Anaerolineae bacterium]
MDEGTKTSENMQETRAPRLGVRILGLVMIITAVLIVWYAIVVYIGYQQGQELLQEKQINTLTTQVNTQLDLARQNINEGQYRLARTRLDWVVEHAPNNQDAATLLAEIDTRLNIQPTLVSGTATEIKATATATPMPLPTSTPGLIGNPEEELSHIQLVVNNKEWEEAIKALVAFQFQFPNYERETTDRLLYEAYIARGLEIVEGEQVELGLAYFAEAEKLGDLPQTALDYQLWAELYMAGIAYYGVNWDIAAFNFRELCLSAPFFQDSCNLLQQSLIRQGDQFAFGLDWCPAEYYYQEAASYGADSILNDKLGQARATCAEATPTPTEPITDTLGITNTETITNP